MDTHSLLLPFYKSAYFEDGSKNQALVKMFVEGLSGVIGKRYLHKITKFRKEAFLVILQSIFAFLKANKELKNGQ